MRFHGSRRPLLSWPLHSFKTCPAKTTAARCYLDSETASHGFARRFELDRVGGGTLIFDPSVSAGLSAIMAANEERAAGSFNAVPEPSTLWLALVAAVAFFTYRRRPMKTLLLIITLLLSTTPIIAGEGGTGLGGPPGTPEPSTIGLLGAAVLFGIPAWRYYRRRKATEDKENDPPQ